MATYQVRFYKGDYRERQEAANRDRCVAYVEHHFNSAAAPGNYAMAIVGSNASVRSRNWARWYATAVAGSFGIGLGGEQGVLVGGYGGRGDANVRFTNMPAILVEPLFANNPTHAEWIRGSVGQVRLARILADSIERIFPDGGLIAFSVGHKYKTSSPNDRGAPVTGGGMEADFAEQVLLKAAGFLEQAVVPTARPIVVQAGNREVFRYEADADAIVRWDELRGVLFVDEPGLPAAPAPAPSSRPAAARAVGAARAGASGARAAKRVSRPASGAAAKGAAAARGRGAKSAAPQAPKPGSKGGGSSGPKPARKRAAKGGVHRSK